MDAVFDKMFAVLNESDSESDDDNYDDQLDDLIEQIRKIDIPPPVIVNERPMVEVIEFDPNHNILDDLVREKFLMDITSNETNLFSNPVSTTITMEGFISNVKFHEAELIHELEADEDIVMIKCNFGKKIHPAYFEPVKVKLTNRGRKKKLIKKKQRKIQGDGSCFNSQITFVVRSQEQKLLAEPLGEPIKVYKFKVFRTGKLQLPGVKPKLLNDILACTNKIVELLNFHLHTGIYDPARISQIININPVMKNYKFYARIAHNQLIDLSQLKKILMLERIAQNKPEGLPTDYWPSTIPHPPIFDIKYTREETKLSIKFHTPIPKRSKKRTRVNIFMRGKINLLGAFDEDITRQIYEYLLDVFERNYNELITEPNFNAIPPAPVLPDNIIHNETEDEIFRICAEMTTKPKPADEELKIDMDFLKTCYEGELEEANIELANYLQGTDLQDFIKK